MTKGYFVFGGDKYEIYGGEAREGDLVLFNGNSHDISYGSAYEVMGSVGTYIEFNDDAGDKRVRNSDDLFMVLRKSDEIDSEPPLDILDMLTSLSRKYNELDERLDSVEKDVGTISIDGEEVAHKLGEIGGILNG